jgi:hypothetical protein
MSLRVVIAGIVALFGAALDGAGQAPPQNDIFPLERVQAGMRGTAYTVMQGAEVVALDVEIYGVLHDFIGPKKDLIVGKLVDERTKFTGAVHGMSGSPLYIEGKVAGALSYRLTQFEKEGWCGFTPIADMIEAGAETRVAPRKTARLESALDGRRLASAGNAGFQFLPADPGGFRPLAVPVTIGGLGPAMFEWLRSEFATQGFDGRLLPVMGGGGQENKPLKTPFEPGAPVAAVLATGDLHMAGTGTLTWRRGNRVLGFGHPMSQNGKVAIPMARAEIVATISSYLYPHKISNTRQIIGTIYQDRLTAIAGEIGPVPPMTELSIRLRSPRGERSFNSRLYQHEAMTPGIAASCVGQTLMETMEYSREFSLAMRGEVELKGHGKIRVENFYSGSSQLDYQAPMRELANVLADLFENRAEMPQIERITLQLTRDDERRVTQLGEIYVDRDRTKPGDTVTVRAVLKPWRGEPRVATLEFAVPENVRSGELEILVGDALAADALDGKSSRTRVERPQNLDQLVNVLNQRRASNALYLRVTRKADGIVVADQRMPALPPSAMQLYDSSRTMLEATRIERMDVVEKRLRQDAVVRGSQTLKVKIE